MLKKDISIILNSIPKQIRKKLVLQLCRMCEKQYRKGFQQGATFLNDGDMTIDEIGEFRSEGSGNGYKLIIDPLYFSKKHNPTKRKPTKKNSYEPSYRILIELMHDTEELEELVESVEFKNIGYKQL